MQERFGEFITSVSNNTVKHIKSLQQKKYRDLHRSYIAEGAKLVSEALNSDNIVELVVLSDKKLNEYEPIAGSARDMGVRCIITTENVFNSMSDAQSPQGVMAVVKENEYNLDDAIKREKSFLVMLDEVKDPGNLGTIIRTVDAAGCDGVILLNNCTDPYSPKAVRSTMGSILRVPVYMGLDASTAVSRLSRAGYHIVVSHLNGSDLFSWPGGYSKTALIIGNESHGVCAELSEAADSLLKIPMAGGAESLNASVAAGILIYEIFRKGMKMDGQVLEQADRVCYNDVK